MLGNQLPAVKVGVVSVHADRASYSVISVSLCIMYLAQFSAIFFKTHSARYIKKSLLIIPQKLSIKFIKLRVAVATLSDNVVESDILNCELLFRT